MTTRRRRWDVLLSAALFLLLALLFVPECDDCYFIYWDFASWKDFLLVRPIPQEGVVLGVPSNGRYLGNLLGLILGKLAFSPLWPLRVLILGGGMLGLTLLLSRFFQGGPAGGRESFALALFLVVWAPWGIWQQVYSWSAAWANYLAPTLLLLPLLLLLPAPGPLPGGAGPPPHPCPSPLLQGYPEVHPLHQPHGVPLGSAGPAGPGGRPAVLASVPALCAPLALSRHPGHGPPPDGAWSPARPGAGVSPASPLTTPTFSEYFFHFRSVYVFFCNIL